jgi:hypothetical protein
LVLLKYKKTSKVDCFYSDKIFKGGCMSVKPLNKNDFYFDSILNAVLSADGTINSFNCHEFTMVWPSYTAVDLPDSSVYRLVPCKFDQWTNEMEYFDTITNQTVRINLMTGNTATFSGTQSKPASQQNMGWSYSEPTKEKPQPKDPFKRGAVLFHKPTRTKWTYDCVDSLTRNHVLRSFYDKGQATQFFDKDLGDFEELFF